MAGARDEVLEAIASLHPELPKLFALRAYELPNDIRAYYISDRRGPARPGHSAYVFDLLLLRESSLTWVSIEFDSYVVDRRSVRTFPLAQLSQIETRQGGVSGLADWTGCTIRFADTSISLPFDDPARQEKTPSPAARALEFARAIHEAL